jgi:hypothetical protein
VRNQDSAEARIPRHWFYAASKSFAGSQTPPGHYYANHPVRQCKSLYFDAPRTRLLNRAAVA